MLNFADYNNDGASVYDEFEARLPLITTGLPTGFVELPIGHFVYMIETYGRVKFISHGANPWVAAVSALHRCKGDRILYRRVAADDANAVVEDLVRKYSAKHNVCVRPNSLIELDMIVDGSELDAEAAES